MATDEGPATSSTLLRQLWGRSPNEEAWRTFLERYGPLIYRWCRRSGLQHADAEEVSAAVSADLARAMRDFAYDPCRRFRGWLRTVVRNAVRDLLRRRQRHPGDRGSGDSEVRQALEQVAVPDLDEGLVEDLDEALGRDWQLAQQAVANVRQRVHQPHTWEAFWRTAIEGQPAVDVAARLGMTVAAVYVAKNRVGKLLRQEGLRLQGDTAARQDVAP
jgi:RNA polymerase sigma-70 factor (ECF subfamily)